MDVIGKNYGFLHESPILGNNIILLTYGGSYAYGTNVETSDIDIRGITFNPIGSLLGNDEFEQFEDENTDTVIYGLNKMMQLLLRCNPNCIEILGTKPEHCYVRRSKDIDQKQKDFLVKTCSYHIRGICKFSTQKITKCTCKGLIFSTRKRETYTGFYNSCYGFYCWPVSFDQWRKIAVRFF